MKPRPRQFEHIEQCTLLDWCGLQYFDHVGSDQRRIRLCLADLVEASLNGAYLNGTAGQRAAQWERMRRAGAKKSAPDLTINYPRGRFHGMKIEMKKRREQFPSPSARLRAVRPGQAEYLHLMERLGYFSTIAYGWTEAAIAICVYFDWNPRSKGLC